MYNPMSMQDPFNLNRGLVRMSWNKFNLYNLSRKTLPDLQKMSVFQQRWIAKRETRGNRNLVDSIGYHVPNITQRQFLHRHFTPKLPFQKLSRAEREKTPPIQALCFAELERRIDVVVFRSHFARSIWHARRAVSLGKVLVNGKKVCFFTRM
jgi:ribosomal protein S4